eukprot:1445883-Lingulodinium_polyedra.AAC.1
MHTDCGAGTRYNTSLKQTRPWHAQHALRLRRCFPVGRIAFGARCAPWALAISTRPRLPPRRRSTFLRTRV